MIKFSDIMYDPLDRRSQKDIRAFPTTKGQYRFVGLWCKNFIRDIIERIDNLRLALDHVQTPRVFTVDKNTSYPPAIEILKKNKELSQEILMRQTKNPEGFTQKTINLDFMHSDRSKNRDFGTEFYTIVDFRQAALWARKSLMSAWELGARHFEEEELPMIVQIRCIQTAALNPVGVLDFRGEGDKWSNFHTRPWFWCN